MLPRDRQPITHAWEASVSLFSVDAVGQALNAALDGVTLRQRVIADNIANVDTPNFRATSVDFETSLRAALGDGELTPGELTVTATPTRTPVGANGNNVDLRQETMAAVQSQFQYQVLTRAMNDRFKLVTFSVGGQ
jgi:flagellar basal-body rod protein FlgB